MSLQGKVIVITGAARGIGFATAKLAASRGAKPVICDLDPDRVEAASRSIQEEGGDALGVVGDVSSASSVAQNVDDIIAWGERIDVLVNNAAAPALERPDRLSEAHWRRELDVCLTGSFLWSQRAAVRSMIPRRTGAIINVGSGASFTAIPSSASYVAAKHGVVGLTRALAIDWAQYGIRVNCICPGHTWTDLAKEIIEADPERMRQPLEGIPLGRGAQPEDIADAILFLASDEASAITGVALPVDNGVLALSSGYAPPKS